MTQDPGLASWLQLTLTPGLGAASLGTLFLEDGLPQAVLQKKRSELAAFASADALGALDSSAVREAVERSLQWAQTPGHAIVTLADEAYPRALLEIADPPALLYAAGRIELASRPALAVVGSRNASAQGERNAESFARALSDAGLTIVSGLALGIDAAAHRGGLAGPGRAARSRSAARGSTSLIRFATPRSRPRWRAAASCFRSSRPAPRLRHIPSRAATGCSAAWRRADWGSRPSLPPARAS